MAILLFRSVIGTHVLMLLCFSSLSAGFNNATSPLTDNQPVGWQAGSHIRGTWTIASTCLSTIFACTWSIQHLNIPGPPTSDGKWTRRFRSCKWMIITVLFPEFMVLQAAFELLMAIQALKLFEYNKKPMTYPWWYHPHQFPSILVQQLSRLWRRLEKVLSSCSHNDRDPEEQKQKDSEDQEPKDQEWTLTHCFFANMGGFYYKHQKLQFPLTASQLAAQHDRFYVPQLSEKEIQDKSKRDWFAKAVTALQFSQLALSLIVRTYQGLDFSQLETITLGYAVCGAIIYLLYLYKPQNVETPLLVAQGEKDEHPILYERTYDSFWDILTNRRVNTADPDTVHRIPNDNIPIVQNSSIHPGVFLLAFASGLFGALHAIAWDFEFPTPVERIFWRSATVVAAASPVVGLITIPLAQLTVSSGDPHVFLADCLRLLREYSWDAPDKGTVEKVYEHLEDIFIKNKTVDDDAKQFYKSIFSETDAQNPELGKKLLEFIESGEGRRSTTPLELRRDFPKQFRSLCELMEEKGSKRLCEEAKTNVFPRKNLLPKAFNLSLLSLTSILYCLSRLSLLAISLSSLRRMPMSVYRNTPWTAYIPSLGSTN